MTAACSGKERPAVPQRLLAGSSSQHQGEALLVPADALCSLSKATMLTKGKRSPRILQALEQLCGRGFPCVRVEEPTADAEEQAALEGRCEELECGNSRINGKLKSALSYLQTAA
ncbi:uncharacterized protein LOC144112454 [Amblyomma americanum]